MNYEDDWICDSLIKWSPSFEISAIWYGVWLLVWTKPCAPMCKQVAIFANYKMPQVSEIIDIAQMIVHLWLLY